MLITTKLVVVASMLFYATDPAIAQGEFPNKPIRMLVPLSAGSAIDIFVRDIGQKMSQNWGRPVVVDNRPSAGGIVASQILLGAAPDGHTLMMVSTSHAVNASLYTKLPYDTVKDFAGITLVAEAPHILVATRALGIKSVRELIELAKSKPGQINFASGGIGSGTHLVGEQFKLEAGIDVVHVPFKGTPEALAGTIGASTEYFFSPITVAVPLVKSGKVTGLAVTSQTRTPVYPDMPTVPESGLSGFYAYFWAGLVGSAKLPKDVKDKIAKEVARILSLQDIRERLLTQGATPHPMHPEEFDAFIKVEIARLGKVVRASGMRAE